MENTETYKKEVKVYWFILPDKSEWFTSCETVEEAINNIKEKGINVMKEYLHRIYDWYMLQAISFEMASEVISYFMEKSPPGVADRVSVVFEDYINSDGIADINENQYMLYCSFAYKSVQLWAAKWGDELKDGGCNLDFCLN